MSELSVVILTYNEELHIERAILSVRDIASAVYVIDSFSTDATAKIAERVGAKVVERAFINQAEQFQWALDNLEITTEWILRLDADEYIDARLGRDLIEAMRSLPAETTGINLDRRHVFMGRWIRYGGRYPIRLLRAWRKGAARVEQRWMDEHAVLMRGNAVTIPGVFVDENLKPLSQFISKHNDYASREALQVHLERLGLAQDGRGDADGMLSSRRARVRRALRSGLYNKVPFPLAALSYFFLRYVLQGGFLDGREGLIYHFLQGFWYRFLVGSKVFEMSRATNGITNIDERVTALQRLAKGK